ncbi:hypothetical protein J921_2743 [Acinetobacter baumannii 25493_8]|nr:hypothetical protein J516_1328 [Acinetobacter baumannii 1406750]EXB59573.1 hypothetical protein J548_1445 [Acinetobacter baumannii 1465485]EXD10464.1 hypothetical protein J499_2040 [Acinetobacter baumannii 1289546]EXD44452.1 hypothetical protein J487_1029 [Acinetobacter baumannii 562700]EXF66236.1 hypothetical protein J565_0436 [Acinetobacter baumannii 1552818]EXG77075.1 hypothetical protein J652_0664 [Acinetobacter baumannii 1296252]EXG97022.1 hypothetical protein J650_0718 [Acinetobacter
MHEATIAGELHVIKLQNVDLWVSFLTQMFPKFFKNNF